ncbi:acetamidase/formamidase family protein [Streptomyces sp. GESEQ-35]|uniref:acetamidase/formamidase family protein n=1 Tax=Streptomyces sp. GESEQ-35 TaxID=2812657 RepID=UPI001FF2706F|nr:acetamidase/formamidase family protein [Streptomyces sp. GESEQ-35]
MLISRLGRRKFLLAATAVTTAGTATTLSATTAMGQTAESGKMPATVLPKEILQPGKGPVHGDHYLPSLPEQVRWGYVPSRGSEPVLRMRSGRTVTVDTLSHEGLLEDQGRDPKAYFADHGVPTRQVLDDAIAVARDYKRTTRNFDVDGPHVVTGPIQVEGAEPGDVLKIEMLSLMPRVPYGVVSSRHGKGALARQAGGSAPAGITLAEVMPPVSTDGRSTGDPERYGNVSVFTPVRRGHGGAVNGVLAYGGSREVAFPLRPHMGMMGVAFASADSLTAPELNSIPPTLGGGNIDINLLTQGSTFYVPVFAEGALFYTGDPHMAMGNGEVALTAMEGSLRTTFRLTVCKKGSGDAPSVAFHYPFAETPDAWVAVGLSDPDGIQNGQGTDLGIAMRRAVVNALDFLEHDLGMERAVAYAYLSAAADFEVSQVVDRTVGVHGVISKGHFDH